MVKSIAITKVSIRERLVVDAEVCMIDPQDFDFSPRASIEGSTLSIVNEGGDDASTFDLDAEQVTTAERDRMLELRGEIMIRGEDLRAALRKLINSPEYQRMPLESTLEEPSPRIDQINRVVNRYHRKAATQMKKEFPDLANALIEIRRERQLNRQGLGTTNNQSILQQFR